jgi:hypothetical protein
MMSKVIYFLQESELSGNNLVGYQGEAFVFKHLSRSAEIVEVDWPNKSKTETSYFIQDFENEKIYINESGISYDIIAQTTNSSIVLVDVKSTKGSYDISDKLPIYQSA